MDNKVFDIIDARCNREVTRGIKDASKCVTAEQVNKWPESMLARRNVPLTRFTHQPYLPVTRYRHSYTYAVSNYAIPELRSFKNVKKAK